MSEGVGALEVKSKGPEERVGDMWPWSARPQRGPESSLPLVLEVVLEKLEDFSLQPLTTDRPWAPILPGPEVFLPSLTLLASGSQSVWALRWSWSWRDNGW